MLGSRNPLQPGSVLFAGLRARLTPVLDTVGGRAESNGVSVLGAGKSGRTSLLNQLLATELRRDAPLLRDAAVVVMDVAPFSGSADDALGALIERVAEVSTTRKFSSVTETVADACRGIGARRLIIALDNFDAIGSDLTKEQQRDLRSALKARPASYVLAARYSPADYIERIPEDESSELAPMVPVANRRTLRPLRRDEVAAMLETAYPRWAQAASAIAEFVTERVGGHAAWVQAALRVLYNEAETRARDISKNSASEIEAIEEAILDELDPLCSRAYLSLDADCRWFIERGVSLSAEQSVRQLLEMDGWHRPRMDDHFVASGTLVSRWLSERSTFASAGRRWNLDSYEKLVLAVEELNRLHREHENNRNTFLIRASSLSAGRDMPYLRRNVRSAADFAALVRALDRLLFDGTFGWQPSKRTLPREYYTDKRTVTVRVHELRKRWLPFVEPAAPSEAWDGDLLQTIYREWGDCDAPVTSLDFERLGNAVRERVLSDLAELSEAYPFANGEIESPGPPSPVIEVSARDSAQSAPQGSTAVVRLWAATDEVAVSGVRVPMQSQPFKVLLCLAERAGDWVPSEQLEAKVGGQELKVLVFRIRRALAEGLDADGHRALRAAAQTDAYTNAKRLRSTQADEAMREIVGNRRGGYYRLSVQKWAIDIQR